MKVSCLRHGATALNARGVFSGLGSESLLEEQRLSLERVRLEADHYDAIYCSPAVRCKETAHSLRLSSFVEDPRLAERRFGIFDGLTAEQCRLAHPEEFGAFQRFDAEYVIPGGESRAQHFGRVEQWLVEVSKYEDVLAITHGGTVDFLFRLGTGQPLHGGNEIFSGPNAALSVFEVVWPTVTPVEHGSVLTD